MKQINISQFAWGRYHQDLKTKISTLANAARVEVSFEQLGKVTVGGKTFSLYDGKMDDVFPRAVEYGFLKVINIIVDKAKEKGDNAVLWKAHHFLKEFEPLMEEVQQTFYYNYKFVAVPREAFISQIVSVFDRLKIALKNIVEVASKQDISYSNYNWTYNPRRGVSKIISATISHSELLRPDESFDVLNHLLDTVNNLKTEEFVYPEEWSEVVGEWVKSLGPYYREIHKILYTTNGDAKLTGVHRSPQKG